MNWRQKLREVKADFEKLIDGDKPQQQQQQHQQYPGQYPQQYYQQQYPPQQYPQQQYQQYQQAQPPPVPSGHPGGDSYPPPPLPPPLPSQQGGQVYWQARFQPDIPITADWDAKIGNGPDGWGNQELQHYTAEQQNAFYTPDGKLVLRAIANTSAGSPEQRYTSARLVSRQTLDRDQGVLSAVILSPCAEGIWPAFWLLPKEPFSWPTDGEVDIAETWNGDLENHSCLHWGQHHEGDKHRVMGTKIPDMQFRPVRYDFAWQQPGGQPGQGRMVWYIDGRPVMKAEIPADTRPMRDMTILLNVAMGGNVCGGRTPHDGSYDMVIHTLYMGSEPEYGGWQRFENDWANAPDGHTY